VFPELLCYAHVREDDLGTVTPCEFLYYAMSDIFYFIKIIDLCKNYQIFMNI